MVTGEVGLISLAALVLVAAECSTVFGCVVIRLQVTVGTGVLEMQRQSNVVIQALVQVKTMTAQTLYMYGQIRHIACRPRNATDNIVP